MKIEFKEARTEITPEDLQLREQLSKDLFLEAKNSKYNF
jgi:hypothetical protein